MERRSDGYSGKERKSVGRRIRGQARPLAREAGAAVKAHVHEPLRHGKQQPHRKSDGVQALLRPVAAARDALRGKVLPRHERRRSA